MLPEISLHTLIDQLTPLKVIGFIDLKTTIKGIAYNSQAVTAGYLFVAIKGEKTDGNRYIDDAVARGAVAILTENDIIQTTVPVIVVKQAEIAMAQVSNIFYNIPTRQLQVIGVTGTNGKTTVTHMIKKCLDDVSVSSGLIGTLGTKLGVHNTYKPTKHTTPQAPDLQKLFYNMLQKGMTHVTMEISSHSLSLNRVFGVHIQTAVFTNLTQDHLDFHVTMENYFNAKRMLFDMLNASPAASKCAVINLDDTYGTEFIATVDTSKVNLITYSTRKDADLKAENIEFNDKGLTYNLVVQGEIYPIKLKLSGLFSVYNSLAAIGALYGNGYDLTKIIRSLETLEAIPGRFETVSRKPMVIVDYAHTPDGLENVLKAAYDLKNQFEGRLITLFGCGGDRDATKRPKMAEAADTYSDIIVVTSDNPRTEDPQQIITDILTGFKELDTQRILVEIDRRSAIEKAIGLASENDVIILAGKGHEDYQILKDKTIHFDDREEARKVLKALKPKVSL